MAWYRTGTVNVTTGSASVTGVGTSWISGASVGEGFYGPDGRIYEITAIGSATQLTLGSPYLGSTQSTATYVIVPSQSYIRDLAAQAATLVNDYASFASNAGTGKFSDGTLASPGIRFTSDENTGLRRVSADTLAVVTGGADRLTVDASGNLGVGTGSPGVRLDVNGGSIRTTSWVDITPSTTTSNALYRATNTGGIFYSGLDNSAGGVTGTAYSGVLWHTGNYPIEFGTNSTERMRISAAGDVGIGTSSPAYKLEVTGVIASTSNASPHFLANATSGNTSTLRLGQVGIVNWDIQNKATSGLLSFNVGGSDLLAIQTGGNVGIGTSSPATKLHVVGDILQENANYLRGKLAAGTGTRLFGLNAVNSLYIGGIDASQSETLFVRGGTTQMTLDSSGNLGLGVVPNAWSGATAIEVSRSGNALTAFSANNLNLVSNAYFNGTNWIYAHTTGTNSANRFQLNGGSYVWDNAPAGAVGATATFTERMRLDSSGNLGIGTSSPTLLLQIGSRGGMSATGIFQWGQALTGNNRGVLSWDVNKAFIGTPQNLVFCTNSETTERMTLDSSGNLGLGVTPSAWGGTYAGVLQVKTASLYSASDLRADVASNVFYNGTAFIYVNTGFATAFSQVSGQHRWFTAPSGTAGNTISFTQAMTLNASSQLLVGTTTNTNSSALVSGGTISETVSSVQHLVASRFDVGTAQNQIPLNQHLGSLAYQDAGFIAGQVGLSVGSASLPSLVSATDTDTGFWFPAANALAASTGGSEGMRLTGTGLGIGTSSPAYKAHIATAQTSALGVFRDLDVTSVGAAATHIELGARNGAAFTAGARIVGVLNNPATTGYLTFDTLSGGTLAEKMRLDSSGNLGIGVVPNVSTWAGGASTTTLDIGKSATYNVIHAKAYATVTAAGGMLVLSRSNSATVGTQTATTSGQGLGYVSFEGINSSSTQAGSSYIVGRQDGAAGTTFVPGRVEFFTSDGTNAPAERARITSGGDLVLGGTVSTPSGLGGRSFTVNATGTGHGGLELSRDGNYIGALRIKDAGSDNNLVLINNTANALIFGTNNVERARITSGGNFGVATTNPLLPIQVNNYGGLDGNGNQLLIRNNVYYDTVDARKESVKAGFSTEIELDNSDGAIKFLTTSSSAAGANVAVTTFERARINSAGDLLVGTTETGLTGKVRVVNTVRVADATTETNALLTTVNATTATIETRYATPLLFGTSATERARITSGGDLLVGTTTNTSKFTVVGSAAAYLGSFWNGNATPVGVNVYYSAATPNNTGSSFFVGNDLTAIRAEIRSNGGLANYSANNVNLSDRREKTNFAPAKDYLDTICAIPVQTFNYIDQSEDDPGLTLGVVAQDVQAVAPELVMESNWGTAENPKMRLSIYQTDLQYALMKCIQELKAEVDTLTARVAALEA